MQLIWKSAFIIVSYQNMYCFNCLNLFQKKMIYHKLSHPINLRTSSAAILQVQHMMHDYPRAVIGQSPWSSLVKFVDLLFTHRVLFCAKLLAKLHGVLTCVWFCTNFSVCCTSEFSCQMTIFGSKIWKVGSKFLKSRVKISQKLKYV